MDVMTAYYEYMNKIGDRTKLYSNVAKTFQVSKALYPGSHIDITPSLFIPCVTYVDSFRDAILFFNQFSEVQALIHKRKNYNTDPEIRFLGMDYHLELNVPQVDLLISQYAGFIGQATKKYLKHGGILLCNDSHGDATLAYLDADYEFIAVVNDSNDIEFENLEQYFTFKRPREIDSLKVTKEMKGPKYKKQAPNYLFRLNKKS